LIQETKNEDDVSERKQSLVMDNFSRIEDYLDGLMTDSERRAFEADLRTDPSLASDLAYLHEAREGLTRQWAHSEQQTELVKILKPLGKQHFGPPARPLRARLQNALWGLAAVITAGLILWLVWNRQAPKRLPVAPMLFARHFRPSLDFGVARSVDGSNADTLAQVEQAYKNGDYACARTLLFARSENATGHSSFVFLQIGQLYLLGNQPDSARLALAKVENGYSQQRDWYLAMSALAANDPIQAKIRLERLAAVAGPFQKEAQEIFDALE